MCTLSWPDHIKRERMNRIIYKTALDPFGLSAYVPGEPVTDFVGRQKELAFFKQQINRILQHGISRAVRLQGPGGVGKSTLFNYLKQSIEKERAKKSDNTDYISEENDIFSTYFDAPEQMLEFKDIWYQLMDTIRANFETELGNDLSLPEYVAFQIVFHLFKENPKEIAQIIWPNTNLEQDFSYVQLQTIIKPIYDNAAQIVPKLQSYFRQKSRNLRPSFKSIINRKTYEISRKDTSRIANLFRVLDETDPEDYLDEILRGSKKVFHNNGEIIRFFNDIMRYYACCTKKQPILLIGIDEIAKSPPNLRENYFYQLGKLFVNLRNNLHYTIFVFISTTEDWEQFDIALKNKSDLQSQISEFLETMILSSLGVNELIQVFKNRMIRFWNNYSADVSPIAPFYPFSPNTFLYVYRYKNRNLRESIVFLKEMWFNFKHYRRIPKLETIFENMREIRSFDSNQVDAETLRKFDWDIIRKEFEKPLRFNSNSARSSAIETGIEEAWKCLMNNSISDITSVENNPTILFSGHKRRPDVLVRILGNLGAEFRRNIEFQIKAYGDNAFVDLNEIESSIELFQYQYTDFIYFIITGKGLSPKAKEKIQEIELNYPERIRYPSLKIDQINCLYFLALFYDIIGHTLGHKKNDEKSARYCIESILGQTPESFLHEVKQLSYREPSIKATTLTLERIKTKITVSSFKSDKMKSEPKFTDIKNFTPQTKTITSLTNFKEDKFESDWEDKKETLEETQSWINNYPYFKPYKFELCALCQYLQTREDHIRYKNKFTKATVIKNVIIPNAILDKGKFNEMVNELKNRGYLVLEKTSFKLTNMGLTLYESIKSTNFKC
ncbi:ATP-binding protein [Candidatus Harpocratesius sp.]